jgi:hypothetical protein
VRPTRGGEPSSPPAFPASPAGTTFELFTSGEVAATLTRNYGKQPDSSDRNGGPPNLVVFNPHRTLQKDGSVAEGFAEREVVDALHGPTGNKEPLVVVQAFDWKQGSRHVPLMPMTDAVRKEGMPAVLISSSAALPAKTSPSPASEPASTDSAAPSSGSSCGSQMTFSLPGDGFSQRTSPVYSVRVADGISLPSSGRWPTSGFTTSPGELWTAGSSEFPSGGGASSSLPDVLEVDVPARYSLSPRAAAGILRRAQKRGRELPEALRTALETLAS